MNHYTKETFNDHHLAANILNDYLCQGEEFIFEDMIMDCDDEFYQKVVNNVDLCDHHPVVKLINADDEEVVFCLVVQELKNGLSLSLFVKDSFDNYNDAS